MKAGHRSAEESNDVQEDSERSETPPAARGPVNLLELAASRDAGPFNQVFMSGAGHRARLTLTTSQGPWHHHPNTPETFIVLEGTLALEFRNAAAVTLCPGMSLTVPVGVSHRSSCVPISGGRAVSVSLEREDQQVVLEE